MTFHYQHAGPEATARYGLIAEEVAEIAPELVVYDDEGRPFSVRYHLLAPMLLNEVQKQQREMQKQQLRGREQQQTIEMLVARLRELEREADDLVP